MSEQKLIDEVLAETPDDLHDQALRRLKKRRDFHMHLFTYLIINLVVWAVWLVIGLEAHSWFPWPLWVTLGWGVGLIFNAWDVYVRRPITEGDIQREIRRLQPH